MVEPFRQSFILQGRNFFNAGRASTAIKSMLQQIGIDQAIIRRVAIAAYEAEMNVVMYAERAVMTFEVTPGAIRIVVEDEGPGIPDINLAMQEGYSTATPEMREMGFGAGMGLPNIRKSTDQLNIESTVGQGTKVDFTISIN